MTDCDLLCLAICERTKGQRAVEFRGELGQPVPGLYGAAGSVTFEISRHL